MINTQCHNPTYDIMKTSVTFFATKYVAVLGWALTRICNLPLVLQCCSQGINKTRQLSRIYHTHEHLQSRILFSPTPSTMDMFPATSISRKTLKHTQTCTVFLQYSRKSLIQTSVIWIFTYRPLKKDIYIIAENGKCSALHTNSKSSLIQTFQLSEHPVVPAYLNKWLPTSTVLTLFIFITT